MNPFARRQNYEKRTLILYRGITIITWLLVLLLGLVYSIVDDPKGAKTIQRQNADHPSPFALNPLLVAVYWYVRTTTQIVDIESYQNRKGNPPTFPAGLHLLPIQQRRWIGRYRRKIGSHFIVNNCLVSIFILLWVHGVLWVAEVILVINFINLKTLYLRHIYMPLSAQWSVIVGPRAWNFVALFTNGAAMVNATDLHARIVANVFIWSILIYGLYFLKIQQDYISGLALTYLILGMSHHISARLV